MTARHYDNDTALDYVSTLLGMLLGAERKTLFFVVCFLMRGSLGRETQTTFFLIQRNVKALV